MERLTVRDSQQHAWYNNDGVLIRGANGTFHQKKDMTAHYIHDRFVALDKVTDRLAAYEDIMTLNRAQELAQAEKDGRLVVLPAKPDEIVYRWKKGDDVPGLFRLDGVTVNGDREIIYQTPCGETFAPDDFGKTVFLTYKEAEAALKKREEVTNEAD